MRFRRNEDLRARRRRRCYYEESDE